jgi:hypothetical protein
LFNEQGTDFVYIRSGTGFKRRNIKTGAFNTNYAIVLEGLEEDDMIALSDPFLKKEEFIEKASDENRKAEAVNK